MSAIYAVSVDPSIGKVDKHTLSQETLMELFIEGFTDNKDFICGSADNPEDLSEWRGLTFNASKQIAGISWSDINLRGTVALQWMPLTVERTFVDINKLSGTVDLTCLPDSLKMISLSRNEFEGTVDLTQLPCGLQKLFLYQNKFCGSTDFSQLPKSLLLLNLKDTNLEGEVSNFNGVLKIDNSNVIDNRKK